MFQGLKLEKMHWQQAVMDLTFAKALCAYVETQCRNMGVR